MGAAEKGDLDTGLHTYLSIVNFQWVELIWVFDKILSIQPTVSCRLHRDNTAEQFFMLIFQYIDMRRKVEWEVYLFFQRRVPWIFRWLTLAIRNAKKHKQFPFSVEETTSVNLVGLRHSLFSRFWNCYSNFFYIHSVRFLWDTENNNEEFVC